MSPRVEVAFGGIVLGPGDLEKGGCGLSRLGGNLIKVKGLGFTWRFMGRLKQGSKYLK